MADTFKKGDKVKWDTPQGETEGEIVGKLTHEKQIGGHTFKPSPDNPEYEVKSSKSGKHAVHREGELRKV